MKALCTFLNHSLVNIILSETVSKMFVEFLFVCCHQIMFFVQYLHN